MIAYIVKFILCSGLLLLIYRLLLSTENLYRFNRFYLMLSLVLSLAIPLIKMEIPAKVFEVERQLTGSRNKATDVLKDQTATQAQITGANISAPTVNTLMADEKSHQQIASPPKNNLLPYLPVA